MFRRLPAVVVVVASLTTSHAAFAQSVVATAAVVDAAPDVAAVANNEQRMTPTTSVAQPRFHGDSSWSRSLLIALQGTAVAAQALDVHSTLQATHNGAREANPLMAGLVNNTAAFVTVKAAAAAATIFGTQRIARNNRMAAIITAAALNSAYFVIAEHNYRVAALNRR